MLDGIKDASGEGGHMEQVRVERLDHLGLLASVIKDLGLIAMLDKRLVPNEQEVITPGEAVAGMILNGLGFAHRPLSLSEHSVILTLSAAAVDDAQTPDRRSRYTWHSAALTCG